MKQNSFCSLSVWLVLTLGSALAFSAKGQDADTVPVANPLTLENAIRLALDNNPELHAAGARVNAATGQADQAKAWSNPELELNAEDWPANGGRGISDAKQTIGISQTLPFPGKKSLDRQMGGAGVKLLAAELALRRTEIIRDVKAGFFRVLASERLAEVSAQLVTVAESSAATAQKRVSAGAAAYQEQLRAEVQLEQARTELTGFQSELAAARQTFATLLGQPELSNAKLTGALAETPETKFLEESAGLLPAIHPSLNTAQANLERAQIAHRRARMEAYPDVKVGVAGGRIGATDESIIQIGFSLPLPLFDTGRGRRQEAQASVCVAESELQAVRQQLQREWANALKRYRTAASQVAGYRERILPKSAEALQLVQTGFEQGKFNFIDLVDTQRTTAEARLAYQGKLLEMNVAQAELEALIEPQTIK